jgi:hypothetical protein
VDEPRAVGEADALLAAPAEGLDDPDALRRLLDLGGEVAQLVLHPPGRLEVLTGEPFAHGEQRHRAGRYEQPERPVQMKQQRDHRDVGRGVDDEEDDAEGQEPPDHRQVAGGAGQQLARLPTVVERDGQPLEVCVQVAAQFGLHAERGGGLGPAPDEDEHRLDDAEREGQRAQLEQARRVAVAHRAVDDPAHDERHHDAGAGRHAGGDQQPDHLVEVGAHVVTDPPQVA